MTKDDLTPESRQWYDKIQAAPDYAAITALDAEATAANVMATLPPRDLQEAL